MSAAPVPVKPDFNVTYFRSESRPISELKAFWRKWAEKEVTFIQWLYLRWRARKDLFWLGKYILKKDLQRCHVMPCREMFVQKDFEGVYHQGYTIGEVHDAIGRQKREKEMLWLDPRGAYKSTLDGIDCVQWMLNCPDIRILILTGEYKLAQAFMSEIKSYFYLPEKGTKTLLHKLFPEYILTGKDGTSAAPLECPARQHPQKEPTLWVNSIEASLSGWHCDIRKADDVITDENCNTPETREKIKKKFDGTKNLIDEWGFSDVVGTRYFTDDWYGIRIALDRSENPLRYLCRACWTVKPEFADVPLREIKSDMVELLFPEKLTFKSLKQKLMENEALFRCQQLNEPAADSSGVAFTEDALIAHLTNPPDQDGDVFITWDWSFARSNYADYSAGIAARIIAKPDEPPVVYILEIIFDRWKPSELAHQIVKFDKKWCPKHTLIENSNGAELLKMEIGRQAHIYQVPLKIVWKTVDTAPEAKRNNIKGVETLLNNDQLYFCRGSWIDETFRQLTRYTGERKNKGRKDDIPDALGFISYFLPATTNGAELEKLKRERQAKADMDEMYRHIFERPAPPQPLIERPSIKRQLFGSLAWR